MKEYFLFGRIAGQGNPWTLQTKRRMVNRKDGAADLRRWNRVKGRETKLIHTEPQPWTPAAITTLQDRGILPR